MKNKISLFFAFIFTITMAGRASSPYAYLYEGLPFEMPVLEKPAFPQHIITLREFGGNSDGVTLNTAAFESALSHLESLGGGTLNVPAGVWYTGPIVLRSNINLHLEKGALILFSADFDLYPLVETIYEGLDTYRCQSPISGRGLENVAITGHGTINGSGQAWRPLKKVKVSDQQWKEMTSGKGVFMNPNYWFPSESSLLGEKLNANTPDGRFDEKTWMEVKDYLRPVLLSLIDCKNVLLEGVLFENSPAWNLHPLMCENVILDNITVRNPYYAQNGDGLDLESCVNSIVVNCYFDVGDDGICIKSGKNEDGRRRGKPTRNLIVNNCKVFHGHGGFVIGSEMSGGVSNVRVSNCQFLGTDIGLRFKGGRGRGGVVENIYIDSIYMFDIVKDAFIFDLYYGGDPRKDKFVTPEVDRTTPVFRNIFVNNVVCRNAGRAMFFNGLPEMNIYNVTMSNSIITATRGAEISESESVRFENVRLIQREGPAFSFYNVRNFDGINIEYDASVPEPIQIDGVKSSGIQITR